MFHKILLLLGEHFNATPKEARGYLMTVLLSFVILLIPVAFRHWVIPRVYSLDVTISPMPTDTLSLIANQLPDLVESDIEVPTVVLQPFDPNTVTIDEMVALGFPNFIAKRIDNYRNKGGVFRKKEDLRKIYDFPESLYQQLVSYIDIPDTSPNKTVKTEEKKAINQVHEPAKQTISTQVPFDLNQADSLQLVRIRGIGPVLANRIMKYRSALGGFHHLSQLKEVYRLEPEVIAELEQHSFVKVPTRFLKVNSSNGNELLKHPYLWGKRKEMTRLINYRQQHGTLTSPEDLYKSKSLDSATIQRILPYVDFNP